MTATHLFAFTPTILYTIPWAHLPGSVSSSLDFPATAGLIHAGAADSVGALILSFTRPMYRQTRAGFAQSPPAPRRLGSGWEPASGLCRRESKQLFCLAPFLVSGTSIPLVIIYIPCRYDMNRNSFVLGSHLHGLRQIQAPDTSMETILQKAVDKPGQ
jgi:hypothetical protein